MALPPHLGNLSTTSVRSRFNEDFENTDDLELARFRPSSATRLTPDTPTPFTHDDGGQDSAWAASTLRETEFPDPFDSVPPGTSSREGYEKIATAPTPPQPQTPGPTRYHIFRYWKWEIISLLLVIGIVVAMFVLLVQYDKQRVQDWAFPINLSTLLAVLATIFRTLILVPLASVISQSKWIWLGRERVHLLQHFQDFDAASRSALGAVSVIPLALRSNIPVSVAATLTLISFATAPFVQQAVRQYECSYSAPGTAAIPAAHFVPRSGVFPIANDGADGVYRDTPNPDTQNMVYSSITSPAGSSNQVRASCTSGNCTFDQGDPLDAEGAGRETGNATYSSMALCHACLNVTSLMNATESMSYRLPNGMEVSETGSLISVVLDSNLTWAGDAIPPEMSRLSTWALANVSVATMTQVGCRSTGESTVCPSLKGMNGSEFILAEGTVRAATCVLYPCIRTYTANVTNNNLTETQVSSTPASKPPGPKNSYAGFFGEPEWYATDHTAVKSPCRVDGVDYTTQNISTAPNGTTISLCASLQGYPCVVHNITAPEQCIYRQAYGFAAAIQTTFSSVFSGSCRTANGGVPITCELEGYPNGGWLADIFNGGNMAQLAGNATYETIEAYISAFAVAMSNQYRANFGSYRYGNSTEVEANSLPAGEFQGIVWQTTVCTRAELAWLTLPTALAAATAALLAWMVAQTWRRRHLQPVWKASLLPLILYKNRLQSSAPPAVGTAAVVTGSATPSYQPAPEEVGASAGGGDERLLELNRMQKLAGRTELTFGWGQSEGQVWEPNMRNRRPGGVEDADVDSLLEREA